MNPEFLNKSEAETYAHVMQRLFVYDADKEIPIKSFYDNALAKTDEFITVARTLDNEAFIATCVESARLDEETEGWHYEDPDNLKIEPSKLMKEFKDLVGAFQAEDEDALGQVRARLGVIDEELWEDIKYNLENNVIPELRITGHSTHYFAEIPLPDLDASAVLMARQLTFPSKRLDQITEANNITWQSLATLALIDPDRAKSIYEELLSDDETYYSAAEHVPQDLGHFTIAAGEESLTLWVKVLSHSNAAVRFNAECQLRRTIEELKLYIPPESPVSPILLNQLMTLEAAIEEE